MKFKIPYYIENCGDGSAAIRLCKTVKEAKKLDANQSEGWGEPSASELEVTINDGKLCFETWDEDYNTIQVKINES